MPEYQLLASGLQFPEGPIWCSDGSVLLDGARVELAALAAELRVQHAQAPQAVLSLDSSGDAEYRAFVQALAAARNAGYRDIAIRR